MCLILNLIQSSGDDERLMKFIGLRIMRERTWGFFSADFYDANEKKPHLLLLQLKFAIIRVRKDTHETICNYLKKHYAWAVPKVSKKSLNTLVSND